MKSEIKDKKEEEPTDTDIDGCPVPDDLDYPCNYCNLQREIEERWAYKQNQIIMEYPKDEWDYLFKEEYKRVVKTALRIHRHYRDCPRYREYLIEHD